MDTKLAQTKAQKIMRNIVDALNIAYDGKFDSMDEDSIEAFEGIEDKLNAANDCIHELIGMLTD